MIALLVILGYFLFGGLTTRLMLKNFWGRAEVKNFRASEFEGPASYVGTLAVTQMLFWPILFPINLMLGSVHNTNPENLQHQLKAKEKQELGMQKQINALEKANGMELTRW